MTTRAILDGIGAIVFDAVGTLIHPSPSVADVYTAAALRRGVVLERDEVKARFGRHFRDDEADERRGPLATDEPTERRRWRRIVADVLPELPDPDEAFGELWDHFGRSTAWRPFSDVGPALRALRAAGMPMRIASNFDARLRGVVGGMPEVACVAAPLVISSEIGYRKPHPAFYHAACASLGFPPERVLYVGDDPENDVRGAGRAGLRGLLLDRDGDRPEDMPHLPDLTSLVANLHVY